VLKDEDPISNYKIQNGHTLHMVKGAAKPAAAAASSSAPMPRLPQMGTGLNVGGDITDSIENHHHVSAACLEVLRTADVEHGHSGADEDRDWGASTRSMGCQGWTTCRTRMR
jgi:hypothetical protein